MKFTHSDIDAIVTAVRPTRCTAKRPYFYEVTGHGHFPDDMLRYDQADVVSGRIEGGRLVLRLKSERLPTVDRWRSFLWTVGSGRTELMSPTRDPDIYRPHPRPSTPF